MNVFTRAILLLALLNTPALAVAEDVSDQLTDMLNEFLAGASTNDASAHERFWADDLIYTSSSGERFDKAQIMSGVTSAAAPGDDEPKTLYTAEHIIIHSYGSMAVVAFQLVGTTQEGEGDKQKARVSNFLNTGTFLEREGVWQVVAWQATRMAEAPAQGD